MEINWYVILRSLCVDKNSSRSDMVKPNIGKCLYGSKETYSTITSAKNEFGVDK